MSFIILFLLLLLIIYVLLVILFYKTENSHLKQLLHLLEKLTQEFEDKVKFVKINAEELFRVTNTSQVDIFPTIMIIYNREELTRWEGEENFTSIKELKAKLSSM